jgi:branched-chain amino acid transport system substrate-binding protein
MLLASACTSGGDSESADSEGALKVGVVTSKTGAYEAFGNAYIDGFESGLKYATDGTNEIDGRKVEVKFADDASDPAIAVSEATDLVADGYKVLAGTITSDIATGLATFAEQNQVLYVAGTPASTALTGINKYTFRSGHDGYQELKPIEKFLPEGADKSTTLGVLTIDNAYGQGIVAQVNAIFGDKVTVETVSVPQNATDLTPFVQQIVDLEPDLLNVSWPGDISPVWNALNQQDVPERFKTVSLLNFHASWPSFGKAATNIDLVAHYFAGAADTPAEEALQADVPLEEIDLSTNDGFVGAQMVVEALTNGGGDDVDAMIEALEGFTFEGPKGETIIRASDHAIGTPMFLVKLSGSGDDLEATANTTLDAESMLAPEAG